MNNIGYSIAIIAIVAVCTVFIRSIPFFVFGGKREVPEFIHYLGNFLPAAIMATLVVYCLRSIHLLEGNHGLPELIATGLVILLHLWKKNILLTVSVSTICYMAMIQVIFK